MAHSAPKLLDYLRDQLRAKHYSIRTETAYADRVRRFILCHDKRHPETMAELEINAFLTSLAVQSRVAAYTQNQAQSALLFLYRPVLQIELDGPLPLVRATKPQRLPIVLTRAEVRADLARGLGAVYLSLALERKYPNANRERLWQYVFASDRISRNPDCNPALNRWLRRRGRALVQRSVLCPNPKSRAACGCGSRDT